MELLYQDIIVIVGHVMRNVSYCKLSCDSHPYIKVALIFLSNSWQESEQAYFL